MTVLAAVLAVFAHAAARAEPGTFFRTLEARGVEEEVSVRGVEGTRLLSEGETIPDVAVRIDVDVRPDAQWLFVRWTRGPGDLPYVPTMRAFRISSGSPLHPDTGRSHLTPAEGCYAVDWLVENHVSRRYGSRMGPTIFFNGDIAIHSTDGPDEDAEIGTPASHGCIRLPPEAARFVFDLARERGSVTRGDGRRTMICVPPGGYPST